MSLRCLVKLWLLLHFLLFSAVCVQSQSTCTAGDDNQNSDDESSNENFYANLRSNDRASCAGTVVAWRYCYYTDVNSGETHEFDAAMYRVQSDDDLELVSGSLRNIRLTGSDILSTGGSFACDTLSLDEADQFEVQEGDVVAACIRDRGGSRKALSMISTNGPSSSSVVTADKTVCDSPNFINDNELSSQQDRTVLHLYVDIQVPPPPTTMPSQEPTTAPPTTMPSQEPTTDPPTTMPSQEPTTAPPSTMLSEESTTGAPTTQVPCSAPLGSSNQEQYTLINDDLFLLDVNHPAQCDGTVESLNYCVYQRASRGFPFDNVNISYEAYVAVYRPETNGVNYNRVSNFTTFSQFQFDIDDPSFFGCFEQATSLTVQTGDVLGVCQVDAGFGIGRLNVIGTGAPSGNSLLVASSNGSCTNSNQTSSVDINDGSFQSMDGYVMHIQANISVTLSSTVVTPTSVSISSMTVSDENLSTMTIETSTATTEPEPFTTSTTLLEGVTTTSTPRSQDTTTSVAMSATSSSVLPQSTTSTAVSQSSSSTTAVSETSTTTTIVSSVSSTAPPQDTTSATTSTISSTDVPIQPTSTSSSSSSSTSQPEPPTSSSPTTTSTLSSTDVPIQPTSTSSSSSSSTSQPEPATSSSPSTTSTQAAPTSDSADTQTETQASATSTSVPVMQDSTSSAAPSTMPTIADTEQPPGQTGANNSDTIIAVVIVLIMTVIVASGVVIGFVMCYRRGNVKTAYTVQRKHLGAEGFENAMYSSAGLPDDNDADYEKIPIGNIQISGSALSYNVPVSSVHTSKPKFYQPLPPLPAKPDDSTLYETPLSPEASMPIYEYTEFGSDLIMNQERDIYANLRPYCVPAAVEDELYVQLKAFGIRSIRRDEIQIGSHLDSGQFGSVDQGVWSRPNDSAVAVALKTLKGSASEQDKVRFLQEGAIMAQFKHPNVISLHGVVSGEPLMLVVELVNRGDLRKYLISARSEAGNASKLGPLLLSFSRQVALGMQYLTGKKFVHRDLAARNILVSSDNVCKVADFGMSRDLVDEQYYVSHGGKIPVKWTAPEALHFKKYSTASDVWSYGCLLYEIWSLGHKPFEGSTNVEVLRLVERGYRLPPPPGCPRRVYELMMVTWNPESARRPGFRDLLLVLMTNEEEVLCVPSGHEEGSQVGVLGAPLKEGEALYPDLQRKYLRQV